MLHCPLTHQNPPQRVLAVAAVHWEPTQKPLAQVKPLTQSAVVRHSVRQ